MLVCVIMCLLAMLVIAECRATGVGQPTQKAVTYFPLRSDDGCVFLLAGVSKGLYKKGLIMTWQPTNASLLGKWPLKQHACVLVIAPIVYSVFVLSLAYTVYSRFIVIAINIIITVVVLCISWFQLT